MSQRHWDKYAGVAELADALDLGSSAKSMQVRPLSPAPKKDCNFDTKLQSFLTKSAFSGINPLSWMKSLRDEILLCKVKERRI